MQQRRTIFQLFSPIGGTRGTARKMPLREVRGNLASLEKQRKLVLISHATLSGSGYLRVEYLRLALTDAAVDVLHAEAGRSIGPI
jgi:hypothetical protein